MKYALLLPGLAALFWPPLADALAGQSRLMLMAALCATVCAWPREGQGIGSAFPLAVCLPWLVAAWRLDTAAAAFGIEGQGGEWTSTGPALFTLSVAWILCATWWGAAVPKGRHGWHWCFFGLLWLMPAAVSWWGHEAGIGLPAWHWFPLPGWCAGSPVDGATLSYVLRASSFTLGAGLVWHLVARRKA